eukprot:TRINITY_DN4879_c0_g2_i1.p1 TRINITY_DN4879_c0_g2~~TRINITY_DN4879_c0_g2_i1.p1  ORF type:complete len:3297 (+),score=473.87 TRINITY_DN4879_c0_g2_i1:27-9893(+)
MSIFKQLWGVNNSNEKKAEQVTEPEETKQLFLNHPESAKLTSLWEIFVQHLGSTKEEKKLVDFLSTIDPEYHSWTSTSSSFESPLKYNFSNFTSYPIIVVYNLHSHLVTKLKLFWSAFKEENLSPFTDSGTCDGDYIPTSGYEYLYLLLLLTRSEANISAVVSDSECLNIVLKILLVAVEQSKNLQRVGLTRAALSDSLESSHNVLNWLRQCWFHIQQVMGYCLTIVVNCTRPVYTPTVLVLINQNFENDKVFEHFKENSNDLFSTETLKKTNEIESSRTMVSKAKMKLFEQSFLATINDLFEVVNGPLYNVLVPSPTANDTLVVSLRFFGISRLILTAFICSCVDFTFMKNDPNVSSFMHRLVQNIGWPSLITQVPWIGSMTLDYQFKYEITCFGALIELIDSEPGNARKFLALQGYERIIDLVFWTSYAFNDSYTTGNTQSSPSPKKLGSSQKNDLVNIIHKPVPWNYRNRRLMILFRLIYEFALEGKNEYLSRDKSSYPSRFISNKTLLNLIFDLFLEDIRHTPENTKSRIMIKEYVPELQLFVLEFLSNCLIDNPVMMIGLYHKYNAWEVLFSSFFISPIKYINSIEYDDDGGDVEANPSSEIDLIFDRNVYSEFSFELRRYLTEFFTYLLSVSNDVSNEISVLKTYIQKFMAPPRPDYRISRLIAKIISQLSLEDSQKVSKAFDSIRFLDDLANFLNQIQNEARKISIDSSSSIIVNNDNIENGETTTEIKSSSDTVPNTNINRSIKSDLERLRSTLMTILTTYLEVPTGYVQALQSIPLVNLLFNLLMDEHSRRYSFKHISKMMQVVGDSPDVRISLSNMFNCYMDMMVNMRSQEDKNLLFYMLDAGLSNILNCANVVSQQELFRREEAFEKITSLLCIKHTPDKHAQHTKLCMSVMVSLRLLMAGNRKNREYVQSVVGYDRIITLVCELFGDKLPPEILEPILDIIVDGKFLKSRLIQNKDAIIFLFKLLSHYPEAVQCNYFSKFTAFLDTSVNKALACQSGLIAYLIKNIPTMATIPGNDATMSLVQGTPSKARKTSVLSHAIALLELLCKQSISAGELKRLLHLIQPRELTFNDDTGKLHSGQFIPDTSFYVLEVVNKILYPRKSNSGPLVSFDFDGKESYMVIQNLNQFPPSNKAFTLVCWVRVESFHLFTSETSTSLKYKPRILSAFDEIGNGFEIFFTEEGRLTFRTIDKENKENIESTVVFDDFEFLHGIWYYIALTCTNNTRIFGKASDIKLYVPELNGPKLTLKYKGQRTVRNLVSYKSIQLFQIGASARPASNFNRSQSFTMVRKPTEKIGGSPLSSSSSKRGLDESKKIDRKKVKNSSKFNPPPLPSPPDINHFKGSRVSYGDKFNGQIGNIYLFDDELLPSTIMDIRELGFEYDGYFQQIDAPQRTSSSTLPTLFDGTLTDKIILAYNSKVLVNNICYDICINNSVLLHATAHKVNRLISTNVNDLISSIGGVKVIIPLFSFVNQPFASEKEKIVQYNPHPKFLQLLFKVLRSMIKNQTNKNEILRCNGISVVAYILLQTFPHHFSIDLIKEIMTLLQDQYEESRYPSAVERLVLSQVLLDLDIWVYSDYEIQQYLLSICLPQLYSNYFMYLRRNFGVRSLLETIRLFYWEVREPRVSRGANPLTHPIKNTLVFSRPTADQRASLRQYLYSLIKTILLKENGLTKLEVKDIISFIFSTTSVSSHYDPVLATEALDFLEAHLINESQESISMDSPKSKLKSQSTNRTIFEGIMSCGGLNIFKKLLSCPYDQIRIISLSIIDMLNRQIERDSVSDSSFRWLSSNNTKITTIDLMERIIPHIYVALKFNELTRPVYNLLMHLMRGEPIVSKSSIQNYAVDVEYSIKLFSFLPVICKVVAQGNLQRIVLRDITMLIRSNRDHRRMILSHNIWPSWLLLLHGFTMTNLNSPSSSIDELDCDDAVLSNIIKLVLLDALTETNFHQIMDKTIGYCRHIMRTYVAKKNYDDDEDDDDNLSFFNSNLRRPPSELFLQSVLEGLINALCVESKLYNTKDKSKEDLSKIQILSGLSQSKTSSLILSNIVEIFLIIEQYLFYPMVNPPSTNPLEPSFTTDWCVPNASATRWKHQNMVMDALELVEQLDLLVKNPGTTRVMKWICIRLATASFYNLSSTTPTEKLIFYIRKWLENNMTTTDYITSSDTRFYILYHLVLSVRNNLESTIISHGKGLLMLIQDLIITCTTKPPPKDIAQEVVQIFSTLIDSLNVAIQNFPELVSDYIDIEPKKFYQVLKSDKLGHVLHIFRQNVQGILRESELDKSITQHHSRIFASVCNDVKEIDRIEKEIVDEYESIVTSTLSGFTEIPLPKESRLSKQYYQKLRGFQMKSWKRISRSYDIIHKDEQEQNESLTRWQLDSSENSLRMRLKLKRNYRFNDHKDAIRVGNTDNQVEDSSIPRSIPFITKIRPLDNFDNEDDELQTQDTTTTTTTSTTSTTNTLIVDNQQSTSISPGTPLDKSKSVKAKPTQEITEENDNTQEKVIFSQQCGLVTPLSVTKGTLELTQNSIQFTETTEDEDDERRSVDSNKRTLIIKRWPVSEIAAIHHRKHLFRPSALEIFLTNHTNFFLKFEGTKSRTKFYDKLVSLKPSSLKYMTDSRNPRKILKSSGLTEKWQSGQISNFEYLMHLNTIAGRTYNDLSQYPVFPWVLSDYKSDYLNLDDQTIYRDLSKPVGALNPSRLKQFLERYHQFSKCDDTIPAFLYGSHYSSAYTVAFYLIRMEPFTTIAIALQGGKFDHADRMFHSIPSLWDNCYNSTADVKELIPEFFYLPEMFTNPNQFNLGVKQNGEKLGDIILPSWASSPEEFVRLHRMALESDYVSNNLHSWIDLIFGNKQRGPAAIEANNVFHYLSYEGAVDLDSIKDPDELKVIESTIENFGQTPYQLFNKPHPPRNAGVSKQWQSTLYHWCTKTILPKSPSDVLVTSPNSATFTQKYKKPNFQSLPGSDSIRVVLSSGRISTDKEENYFSLVIVDDKHQFRGYRLSNQKPLVLSNQPGKIPLPFDVKSSNFSLSNDGKYLFSCGHWDNSFKITSLNDPQTPIQSVKDHKGIVTCISLTEDNRYLLTGSEDTTVRIWEIIADSKGRNFTNPLRLNSALSSVIDSRSPKVVLYGHHEKVLSVVGNSELNVCISGSVGFCLIHTIQRGSFVKKVRLSSPDDTVDSIVLDGRNGNFVVYSKTHQSLQLFTINGKHIRTMIVGDIISSIVLTTDGNLLVYGDQNRNLVIRTAHNLETVYEAKVEFPIWSISCDGEKTILVGTDKGLMLLDTTSS